MQDTLIKLHIIKDEKSNLQAGKLLLGSVLKNVNTLRERLEQLIELKNKVLH